MAEILFRNFLLSTSLLTPWITISRRFLPLNFDRSCFSLVPKPCLPVWVRPMISLKARLSLALLMESLTYQFFPVFNVGFSDFITSSFKSSSIIRSLIFPDLNYFTIDLNGNFNCACLQYKATSDKSGGKPNYFLVYLFILASIDSTVLVAILYMNSSNNNIVINICWRHQTLNFPCRGQRSILWRSSCNVLDVSFAWLMPFKDSSNRHPKLFTGSFDTVGILSPPTMKFIFWFTFLFLSERLLDFWGWISSNSKLSACLSGLASCE